MFSLDKDREMICINCKTPQEFLNELAPRNSKWQADEKKYIFRGQSDSEWPLIPSALRDEKCRQLILKEQVTNEYKVLRKFIKAMSDGGLFIPNEENIADKYDKRVEDAEFDYESWQWPSSDYQPIMALAQHNGLPTRLLDWTFHPFIAAYFAAKDMKNAGKLISVHALNMKILETEGERKISYKKIETPTFSNEYLHAQKGIFLQYETVGIHEEGNPQIIKSLEEYVDSISQDDSDLYKLTLPSEKSRELLKLLSYEYVTAIYLYPGMKGVVEFLKEQALYT